VKILVLNCGSTTVKFQLINMQDNSVMAIALVEKIGLSDVTLTYESKGNKVKEILGAVSHKEGIERIIELLTDNEHGVIKSLEEIHAVGHRVVHGGDRFMSSTIITDKILKDIEACIPLAPLHNPANVIGIKAIKNLLPQIQNVAVFDTAYHQTMPATSYRYAIPKKYYTENKIRKYGFHGTSHEYVSIQSAKLLNIPYNEFNAISCHMGGGVSLTAIKNGKSYDTSMGFTPLQGLIMATRSGDIDPAIYPFLNANCGMSMAEIDTMLNKQSGVLGLSGVSSDMRDLEQEASKGNQDCQLALDAFVQRIVHYIGGYAALLGRVDAIIFTAGIGENGKEIRHHIADRLSIFGVELDKKLNDVRGDARVISSQNSKIKLILMPTNEELMIALDTQELVK
jgi:acetate kinase